MTILLPFGIKDNKIIDISVIPMDQNGLKCDCKCRQCGTNSIETALHLYLKEILEKHKIIKTPLLIL